MTNTEPRGPITVGRPSREGNGWSRTWRRTIAGVLFSFTAVVMPITGELRYQVRRFNGYVGGPQFGCAWDLVHSITVGPTPLPWKRTRPGRYEYGHVEIIRDPNATVDNRWSLRYPGEPTSAHRLLKSAQTTAARHAARNVGESLIESLRQLAPLGPPEAMRAQPEQQSAQADEPVPAPVPLPAPTARPTPAEAVRAHLVEQGQYPTASRVVARGADLDELHVALGAGQVVRFDHQGAPVYSLPVDKRFRVNDVVYVTPSHGRQFDVIEVDALDGGLLRVTPRNPRDLNDVAQWVGVTYAMHVPTAKIEPYADDDQGDEVQGDTPYERVVSALGLTDAARPTLAESLRQSAPEVYRSCLTPMLASAQFEPSGGREGDAFAEHVVSGVSVGVHPGGVRLSYPAAHGGDPDEGTGTAWCDLDYGTSYEVIVDLAVGLVNVTMRTGHADHLRDVADELRDLADGDMGIATPDGIDTLHALADRIAPTGTECAAAAYARRVTAVVQGVMIQLVALAGAGEPCGPAHLRALAMMTADLMTAPEAQTAEQVAEHLRDAGVRAAFVADDSAGPADAGELIETLTANGWTLAPDTEYVGGKRVRYMMPPPGVAALLLGQAQPADDRAPEAPELRSPYVGEGADGARRSADIDRSEADTHPTGSEAWARCRASAERWDEQAAYLDLRHSAEEPLTDAGGFLACGCHGSQRDHTCNSGT